MLHALEEPFLVGSAEVSMLASVGVSVSHDPEADPEALLREADVAMYRAKGAGGHRLELFDESLRREVERPHGAREAPAPRAAARRAVLAYQPILPLAGGHAVGCEALVRWHPRDGSEPVQPPTFLSLAEESDLIAQIGDWVLQTACAQAATLATRGQRPDGGGQRLRASADRARSGRRVEEALAHSDLPAQLAVPGGDRGRDLRDPERARSALQDVKRLGVRSRWTTSARDQSSLSLPGSLPFDMLKIDRTLIQHLEHDDEKRAMVLAMIALARETNLTVVAVGIETDQQRVRARAGLLTGTGLSAAPAGFR